MNDDPIIQLERELVRAAERRPAQSSNRLRAGTLALLSSILVTMVVAGGVLVLVHGNHARHPTATTTRPAHNRTDQKLVQILGILRRPQTRLDRKILRQSGLERSARLPFLAGATINESSARLATITPWGSRVLLVLTNPPTTSGLASLHQRFPRMPVRRHMSGLILWVDHGGGCCASATDLKSNGDISLDGAGRSFAGGSTAQRVYTVVPDGVARVAFYPPPHSVSAGGRTHLNGLPVTVPVHGNVGAVQWHHSCCANPPMIWYAADGRVIKRIGDFKSVNRVTGTPRPGPETTLSRAAERDPSTPNRVWVTPSTGGPHTNFKLHFRVLLNDADYSYHLSGTRCPQITVTGGSGGGTNDLRGRIWSDNINAVAGQTWCPGTYHLTATVMDLGRYGQLKHPAKPFGTATFTVHQ